MEPLGTITQYFPFIDEDTREILDEIINEAEDYYDFVERLSNRVLSTESSDFVVYFAIHHAALALDFKVIDKIRERYGDRQILGPYLLYASAYSGNYDDLEKVQDAADAILVSNPDDWIVIEMNCMKFESDMRDYPRTMYGDSIIELIRDYIKKDSRFGFYETTINDNLAHRARIDGDFDERLRCFDMGIKYAEKFDDQVRLGDFLSKKATVIEDRDRTQAKELLKQAYRITEKLGIPADFGLSLWRLGRLEAIRGEFDAAVKHIMQSISIRERIGPNIAPEAWDLSTIYNIIGEPESGLEWAKMTEDQYASTPLRIPQAVLSQAWSLILLGRRTEALILIDTTREPILKAGNESQLAWHHFVTGVMEYEDGDFISAASSVEEALRIYEDQGDNPLIQLTILLQLAKIEVRTCQESTIAFPYLAMLEERALSEDLPGFLGHALLLKAEICLISVDDAVLREVIQQLRPLTEDESMQFLKPHYENLLRRV